jgi:hypothetical protein
METDLQKVSELILRKTRADAGRAKHMGDTDNCVQKCTPFVHQSAQTASVEIGDCRYGEKPILEAKTGAMIGSGVLYQKILRRR